MKLVPILQFHNYISTWPKYLKVFFKSSQFIILILVTLNLCIILSLADMLNIWIDEAYSLHTTGKDLGYAINQALYFELQSPLYFMILNLWRNINSSIFFARLFSVVCTTLTICIIPHLLTKVSKQIHPAWFITPLILNSFVIWSATEIRLYAFLILLSALLLLSFFNGYLDEVNKSRARWFYVMFSVIALYTQYYSAFLLAANGVVLLILRRWHALRNYSFGMVVVGLCFSPMLLVIPHQMSEHIAPVKETTSLLHGLRIILQRIISYNLPLEKSLIPIPENQKSVLYFIFFILIVLIFINSRYLISSNHIAIWGITVVTAFCFLLILNIVGKELITPRHTSILFLPSVMTGFSLLSIMKEKWGKKVLLIGIIITLLWIITLYDQYKPMAKSGDNARVASYIMASEKPEQAILAGTEEALTLSYYYSGKNIIVPLPRKEDFQTYNHNKYSINNEQEILSILSNVPGNHQYIWLVTIDIRPCIYLCHVFEEFVRKYYDVESSKYFFESRVRLLREKPNSSY